MHVSNNLHKVVIVYYIHKNGKFLLVKLFLVYIVGLHNNILQTPIPIPTAGMVPVWIAGSHLYFYLST